MLREKSLEYFVKIRIIAWNIHFIINIMSDFKELQVFYTNNIVGNLEILLKKNKDKILTHEDNIKNLSKLYTQNYNILPDGKIVVLNTDNEEVGTIDSIAELTPFLEQLEKDAKRKEDTNNRNIKTLTNENEVIEKILSNKNFSFTLFVQGKTVDATFESSDPKIKKLLQSKSKSLLQDLPVIEEKVGDFTKETQSHLVDNEESVEENNSDLDTSELSNANEETLDVTTEAHSVIDTMSQEVAEDPDSDLFSDNTFIFEDDSKVALPEEGVEDLSFDIPSEDGSSMGDDVSTENNFSVNDLDFSFENTSDTVEDFSFVDTSTNNDLEGIDYTLDVENDPVNVMNTLPEEDIEAQEETITDIDFSLDAENDINNLFDEEVIQNNLDSFEEGSTDSLTFDEAVEDGNEVKQEGMGDVGGKNNSYLDDFEDTTLFSEDNFEDTNLFLEDTENNSEETDDLFVEAHETDVPEDSDDFLFSEDVNTAQEEQTEVAEQHSDENDFLFDEEVSTHESIDDASDDFDLFVDEESKAVADSIDAASDDFDLFVEEESEEVADTAENQNEEDDFLFEDEEYTEEQPANDISLEDNEDNSDELFVEADEDFDFVEVNSEDVAIENAPEKEGNTTIIHNHYHTTTGTASVDSAVTAPIPASINVVGATSDVGNLDIPTIPSETFDINSIGNLDVELPESPTLEHAETQYMDAKTVSEPQDTEKQKVIPEWRNEQKEENIAFQETNFANISDSSSDVLSFLSDLKKKNYISENLSPKAFVLKKEGFLDRYSSREKTIGVIAIVLVGVIVASVIGFLSVISNLNSTIVSKDNALQNKTTEATAMKNKEEALRKELETKQAQEQANSRMIDGSAVEAFSLSMIDKVKLEGKEDPNIKVDVVSGKYLLLRFSEIQPQVGQKLTITFNNGRAPLDYFVSKSMAGIQEGIQGITQYIEQEAQSGSSSKHFILIADNNKNYFRANP